jgi:hypothetical protein
MKKITCLLLVLVFLGTPLLMVPKSYAAGGGVRNADMHASASSASANGSSTITFTYNYFLYTCSQPNFDGSAIYPSDAGWCEANNYGTTQTTPTNPSTPDLITVTGSNNTLSKTSADGSSGSFTLKSTTAESKTVSLHAYVYDGQPAEQQPVDKSVVVSFVVPSASAPTPKTTTPTTSQSTTNTPQAPAAPTASSVKVDGTTQDASKAVSVASDKPLLLSGKTVPNGVVTLTIHSIPKTVTATADKDGNWSYTVTGLEPGDHYVEASVTDPATSKTSPTAKLLSFTVTAATPVAASHKLADTSVKKSHSSLYVLLLLILAVLAAAGWYGWKWWNKKKIDKPDLPATPAENPDLKT